MIVQNVSGATDRTDISFTLPKADLAAAVTALAELQAQVGFESAAAPTSTSARCRWSAPA